MIVWLTYSAMAILAIIGPALAQDSSASVMMPGISTRGSSADMSIRRRRPRPVREQIFNGASASGAASSNLRTPINFPSRQGVYDDVASVLLPGRAREEEEEMEPVMDVMDTMDVDKMSMSTQKMLNSISSLAEYAAMFGIDMSTISNNTSDSISLVPRFGRGDSEVELPSATCRPEEQTVKLDLPSEVNVAYFPTCVRLQRCGGCCVGSIMTCQPTKTEAITIKVIQMKSEFTSATRSTGANRPRQRPSGRGRAGTRRRRQNTPTFIPVNEEHHTECACQCKVQEQDCNPALHEYMPENCKCHCINGDEKAKCERSPMTHYWDDDLCTCFCLKTSKCSVTLRFDHTSCSCVQVPQSLPAGGSVITPRVGFASGNDLDDAGERFRRDRILVVFDHHGRGARDVQEDDSP